MSGQRLAGLALAGATAAVSVSAILIREAGSDAATVVWLRMALALLLLAPWAVARAPRRRPQPRRRDLVLTLAAGLLLSAHFLAWTASLQDTSVAASVLLVSLHPILVTPLQRRLFGDRVGRLAVAGLVLGLLGTGTTVLGGVRSGGNSLRGDLLALGGGVALAAYLLIGRSQRQGNSVAAYSATVYAVVAAAGAATATAAGTIHLPSVRTLLACLGLAAVSTVGGHTVFNWALRRVPASTVSLSFLGEPPLAALLAVPVLGERPAGATIIGGALILLGLALTLGQRGGAAATAAPPG